jgi:hypothetical protein
MLTVLSSFLFLYSSYIFYKHQEHEPNFTFLYYITFVLFFTSIVYHINGADENNFKYGKIIKFFDRLLATIVTSMSIYLSLKYNIWLPLLFALYVVLIYYCKICNNPLQPCLHCSMHVIGNLGLILFVFLLTKQKNSQFSLI